MPQYFENARPIGAGLTEDKYHDILDAIASGSLLLPNILIDLHPADAADLLERLPLEQRRVAFHNLPENIVADTLAELSEGVQSHLLQHVDDDDLGDVLEELDSDDAADIVQHLDEDRIPEAVKQLEKEEKQLVKYGKDIAGGLMDLDFAVQLQSRTVEQTFKYLRENGDELPKSVTSIFVVDKDDKLVGKVSLSRLVRAAPSARLVKIMRENPIKVYADTPSEDVARLFEKYDMHSCPVVNKRNKIIGRITVDDILDVMVEDIAQDFMHQAGLDERDDLFAPVQETTRARFPWLLVNLFTAILASAVISLFEAEIEQLVALAVLMPIVASMGGNAASQTLTVTVRGLATQKITFKNAFSLLRKEVMVGGFNGILLAALVALGTIAFYGNIMLGVVIFAATVVNHIFAAFAGHLIPLVLEKYKKDPAISSGVLVTTVTDVGGFFVFLGLAALFLL